MPNVPHPSAEPPPLPPEGVRTAISLLLFLHLFSLAVVVISYGNPAAVEQSSLARRLLDVLSPYVETFNLDLGHRYRIEAQPDRPGIEPIARYYLTHAMPTDVDFVVQIEVPQKVGTTETVSIPPKGLWPNERYRRYQSLANAIGCLAGNDRATVDGDSAELILPRAVAGAVLADQGAKRGLIRCQAHLLMNMDAIDSSNAEARDPFDKRYYSQVFESNVLVSGGRVDLLKSTPAGEVAPVEKGP